MGVFFLMGRRSALPPPTEGILQDPPAIGINHQRAHSPFQFSTKLNTEGQWTGSRILSKRKVYHPSFQIWVKEVTVRIRSGL